MLKAGFGPFGGDARWDVLTQRARTTNLAVLLLAGTACISLLLNVRMWLGNEVRRLCISSTRRPDRDFFPPGLSTARRLQRARPSFHTGNFTVSSCVSPASRHGALPSLLLLQNRRLTFRAFSVCRSQVTLSGKAATLRMRRKTRIGYSSRCSEADQCGHTSSTLPKGALPSTFRLATHLTASPARRAEVAVRDPEALLIYSGCASRRSFKTRQITSPPLTAAKPAQIPTSQRVSPTHD